MQSELVQKRHEPVTKHRRTEAIQDCQRFVSEELCECYFESDWLATRKPGSMLKEDYVHKWIRKHGAWLIAGNEALAAGL